MTSGQAPFEFFRREDLRNLPAEARPSEVNLHGGFAIDTRPDHGEIYYGMPGCGILRVDSDLRQQHVIDLPDDLRAVNFHSTKIGEFDGQWRLFLAANEDEKVVVVDLNGSVEFILPRPEFEQYSSADADYKPTDTVLAGEDLFIADGYGSNYISVANVRRKAWTSWFGGKTEDPTEDGKFATAHGLNLNPVLGHLDVCDRPHSRIQAHELSGAFVASHRLPQGAFLCGISYLEHEDRWYAVIGCLNDPDENRPAPIYIIDAQTYELLSTIRPKEELGVELAQHIHNATLHRRGDDLYLICQAWNPGHYFVLQQVG